MESENPGIRFVALPEARPYWRHRTYERVPGSAWKYRQAGVCTAAINRHELPGGQVYAGLCPHGFAPYYGDLAMARAVIAKGDQ